jgi:signal peptidase
MRLPPRRLAAFVAGVPLTVALIAVWVVLLRPVTLGGPAGYVIVSGTSMEPTFASGDLAVTQRRGSYSVGEVVAFETGGGLVIHRIVGGDASMGYAIMGDNRDQPDFWRPRPADILGSVWIRIPGAGNILALIRQPPILAGLAAAAAFFMVFTAGPVRPRRRWSSGTAADPCATPGRGPRS